MSRLRENAESLRGDLESLLENQAAYYRLWSFRAGMKSLTALIQMALLALFGMLALLFLSLAAAFALGEALGAPGFGFLAVGAAYLVLLLALYLLRGRLDRPVLEKFSGIFFAE